MADPTDLTAYDEIARILKRYIDVAVVTESQLLETVDRIYRRTGEITAWCRNSEQSLATPRSTSALSL